MPIPCIFTEDSQVQGLKVTELPLALPEISDVQLLKKSKPLSKISSFVNVEIDGKHYTREVDTMDTFMDSSWYFLRFIDP